MERFNFNELVENSELELTTISTTSEASGYPANVQTAIIGFNNFDEAEKFAKAHHLDIIRVERAFGSDLWTRRGTAYKELERDGSEFGDDYTVYDPAYYYFEQEFNENEFYEKTVQNIIGEMETFDQARDMLDGFEEVSNALNLCDDNELVVCEGSYDGNEIIKKHCMQYSYDSMDYAIVAIQKL